MGLADAFNKEDRVPVTFSVFYQMMKEATKSEFLMNAVRCKVPHEYIYEMATGQLALPSASSIQPMPEETDEA